MPKQRIIDGMSAEQIIYGWNPSQGDMLGYLQDLCKNVPTWEDDVRLTNPVLCWVGHSLEDIEQRREFGFIGETANQDFSLPRYQCTVGKFYTHARPISPDDIWKPT